MCGIVGYVGGKQARDILLDGLRKLEYRGYDSSGIAVLEGGRIDVAKSVGKLGALEHKLHQNGKMDGLVGIGHTRWATHGRPSDVNAHPHQDCSGDFVVVHNGIIENYQELKERLKQKGHQFKSETDTEVIAHLIEDYYNGNLEIAVRKAVKELKGSFALAIMAAREPDKVVAVRKDSPLVIGLGHGENFVASDIPAILSHTRRTFILNDGEMAVITKDRVTVTDFDGNLQHKELFEVKWDPVAAEKGGYAHFMLKEIHEQPQALRETMRGRLKDTGGVDLAEVGLDVGYLQSVRKIHITACGTAYHAGLLGKYLIERLTRLPVEVEVASEFRYREPILDKDTLLVLISQSGETADTLAALREGKKRGVKTLAITNVVGSSVSREADHVFYTWAGPEIAVASTKAYTTQVLALVLFALYLGQHRGTIDEDTAAQLIAELRLLPEKTEAVLRSEGQVQELAQQFARWEDVFFIGRNLDFAVALEGQLKLKEISYIHAEAYPAGELKHGTLALIVEGVPVVSLATQPFIFDKMLSNIMEVKARGGEIIAVTMEGEGEIDKYAGHVIRIPRVHHMLAPILTVVPLQLLAYFAAVARGADVDKPRNLAKSVTVE